MASSGQKRTTFSERGEEVCTSWHEMYTTIGTLSFPSASKPPRYCHPNTQFPDFHVRDMVDQKFN